MRLRSPAHLIPVIACALSMLACGNRDVATASGTGQLEVIVHTPIAGGAAVAIRGALSHASIAATDTVRGLTPGLYQARAVDVAPPDSLVSPVLTGVMSASSVAIDVGEMGTDTATYATRPGSGALWVGIWGKTNLAEGFVSSQLAAAGIEVATDTIGAGTDSTIAGAAFDSAGNLWVTDYLAQRVLKFTAAQLASGESTPAVVVSTEKEPWGIAFDASGSLYIGYYNAGRVLRYAQSDVAGWSGALTDPVPVATIAMPHGPLGLAFDAHGNLWIAGFDNPLTYEVAASQLVASGSIAPSDSLRSSYLDHGSGLAFDRAGNLWEATEGGYIVSWTTAQLATGSHGEPTFAQHMSNNLDAVAFDNSGNLWVATETENVAMFSPAQLASGDLGIAARTLTTLDGERAFSLAFNAHDSALPIASTLASASRISRSPRAPHGVAALRAAPPVVHPNDGSRPGSVRLQ